MTTRLSKMIEAVGLATCGELAARLAPRLGMQTSPTTILRRTMALPTCPPEQVSLLGIDDWSFRRGRKFGTILVDVATHEIIDLLADRRSETAAAWMQAHPEIEIVSRDRGGDYAAAARKGAPQARQVADRFHLAQNLTDRIEVILARCRPEIRKASQQQALSSSAVEQAENDAEQTQALDEWRSAQNREEKNAHLARQAERSDRYHQLVELREEGLRSKKLHAVLGWVNGRCATGSPEVSPMRCPSTVANDAVFSIPTPPMLLSDGAKDVEMVKTFGVRSQLRDTREAPERSTDSWSRYAWLLLPSEEKPNDNTPFQSLLCNNVPHEKRSGCLSVTPLIWMRHNKES